MKNRYIKKVIKLISKNFRKTEVSRYKVQIEVLKRLVNSQCLIDNNYKAISIVFSKDRPIQLHALLSSYFQYTTPIPTYVLYKASSDRHKKAYNDLKLIFKNIVFLEEINFKGDLMDLLNTSICKGFKKIFFMTDDGLFIDNFDMNEFLSINPMSAVISLTRGDDATFCFPLNKMEKLPSFYSDETLPVKLKYWIFAEVKELGLFKFPLSVDGTLFDLNEIYLLLNSIEFKAPNSLEQGMQVYYDIMCDRVGVCYSKSKFVNIHCNTVNEEGSGMNTGFYTLENLLVEWENGNRIVYEDFYKSDFNDVQKSKFKFTKRTL